MAQEFYYREQVIELFDCDEEFLRKLESEDLVSTVQADSADRPVYSVDQVDRIRVIMNLVQEMDVNLPGCEVVLRMRENMLEMQEKFDKILDVLREELRSRSR